MRALPSAWLLSPATGERVEGCDHCLKRLNGYGLYEGFAVVLGRVWKETTPRWQFLCKIHGRATANKRGLEARKYRIGNVSCSESQNLFEQEHQGLILSQKTNYNLLRKKSGDANNPDTITALLKEPHDAGFMYRTRTKVEINENDRVVKRKLIQIIFFHREVIHFAQPFITGKLLIVDGTFNTTKLRLPLLIGVGITNSGKIFPCLELTIQAKPRNPMTFSSRYCARRCGVDCYEPAVIMGDQSAGLISAVDTLGCVPCSQLQFCN